MGVPASEVSYTSAITGREDHEVHKGYVVALGRKKREIKNNEAIIHAKSVAYFVVLY
jgi:hypothetical protein